MDNFRDIIKNKALIADGAMGTMLYEKGIFLNSCFDELCLTKPEIIADIHSQYIACGADIIETNTFGANEFRLGKFGLGDKVEQINAKAVEIAKSVSNKKVFIAGSVGPVGVDYSHITSITSEQVLAAFKRQIASLDKAGVDIILLETFSSVDEIMLAIKAALETTKLPLIAQLTINENNQTPIGIKLETAAAKLCDCDNVDVIGLNCSVGPSAMLAALKILRTLTDKPISVMPNAGLPRCVDGRYIYMSTPEYMAEYAKRFLESGAAIIGGCCGTTPEHIKQIAYAVKAVDKADASAKAVSVKTIDIQKAAGVDPVELKKKSKLGAKLACGQRINCIELVPPRGIDLTATIEKVQLAAKYGIDAINIPDGPRASSRLSPMATAVKIQQSADIEAILHICCRDRNLIGMQSDMLGVDVLGIKNVLLITGDPPKMGEYPDATAVFDLDSVGLTDVVHNLNRGIDIGGNEFTPPTTLTIGVGANPAASDIKREIERFKAKAAAGAEYAITQPVFDEQSFWNFAAAVQDCKLPIIAGIWPFTSFKNAEFMANEVPGVVVPKELLNRMSKAKTKEDGKKIGIEIAQEMVEKLSSCVAGFAVSAPFGNVQIALSVLGF